MGLGVRWFWVEWGPASGSSGQSSCVAGVFQWEWRLERCEAVGGAEATLRAMGRLCVRLSALIARAAVRGPLVTMRGGGAWARLTAVRARAAGSLASMGLPLGLAAARARRRGAVDVRAELGVLVWEMLDSPGYATCHVSKCAMAHFCEDILILADAGYATRQSWDCTKSGVIDFVRETAMGFMFIVF